jgi:hypothetical protein
MTMDERSTLTYLFNGTRSWGVHELGRDRLPRSGEGSRPPNQGRQGSFSDRNGVVLGNAPFASAPYDPTPAPLQIDITALAQNWQANGNRGLMLRATGPEVQFFSRNSRPKDDPANRPYLRVTKANGEIVRLACLSDVSLDWRSPYSPLGLNFFLAVNAAEGEAYRVAMQFEPVVGDFVKAELVLTPFHADGPGVLQVYLLNPPKD